MKILLILLFIPTLVFAQATPQKISKTSLSAESAIQGGNTPFTLLGANLKHLFSITHRHDFSFSTGAQYQKIANTDIRNAHIGMIDDLIIGDDYVFFTALKLKRNDLKRQRLVGAAMMGGGLDFLGKYNRGNDAKYTFGFGYQYVDTGLDSRNDLIITHRLKIDYLTNPAWGLALTLWLKHVLYSGPDEKILNASDAFKTLESSIEIKLTHKHFLNRKNLNFFIATSTEYDNNPLPGSAYCNYLFKLGFDYLLSEK